MIEPKNINIALGKDNIFEDLGFEQQEAINLKLRADLMLDLRSYIQSKKWTQKQAATFLGETQPQINHLMNGEINQFTVDQLINLLGKIGMDVKIEVTSRP